MNKGMSVTIDLSFCLVLGKGFAASGNNSGCTCGPGGDFPGGILQFWPCQIMEWIYCTRQGEAAKLWPDPAESNVQLCSGIEGRKWQKINGYNFTIVKFPHAFGIATSP